nr:hypothetical protein L204_02996 [Cryptococcus depauperatus CBS 7855]
MAPLSREQLWSLGQDEDVEVNQRALIDKILARYSGEHTIFRELLQNSDDAGAQHVQIKFYTAKGMEVLKNGGEPSVLPDVKKDMIQNYVVSNDGVPFRDEDWNRLKKIAEGNPDEEKIGAFGVGFYSLFSVCDGPFVESGDRWMAFYWKDGKDQLLARSGKIPEPSSLEPSLTGHPWTTFTMTLREPSLLDSPLDLAKFFTTSITFMRTVKRIDMFVDGIRVFQVGKKVTEKERVGRPGMKSASTGGMMNIVRVDATGMEITVHIMKWLADTGFAPPPLPNAITQLAKPARGLASMISSSFFGRYSSPVPLQTPPTPPPPPSNPKELTTVHRDIQIYEADIKINISPTYAKELERATKKPAPDRMPASIVYSREEDDEAKTINNKEATQNVAGVFSGLCPTLGSEKPARVFIGQPTSQTTGIGGHLAARFIPTVERESIDLVDKHVSHWNRQLLWVGGYLCRLIYELEMASFITEWKSVTNSDDKARRAIIKKGLYAIRFFSFKSTTPSAVVGQEMEAAFYDSSNDNRMLPILSGEGILPIKDVRMPDAAIGRFLPDLPVITSAVIEQASPFICRLQSQHLLTEVTYDDVIRQLGKRPLTENEMIECLMWWQNLALQDEFNLSLRTRLLDAAIVLLDSAKVLPLSIVNTFIRPHSGMIPPDMPIPQSTIPYDITKNLKANSICRIFGWTELNLLQYMTFLINPPMSNHVGSDPAMDLRVSPEFSERVFNMLGRSWPNLPSNIQSDIAHELKDIDCIPTKAGFKRPGEAYFEKNLLFDDLPIIAFPKGTLIKGNIEKMLLSIGVRKTVDLQLVFSRLIGGGTWSCHDLMRYLVSVKDTLSDEEIKRLRQTAAFPLFIDPMEDGSQMPAVRQKPWQLYEPTETMKSLGLPILDWGETKWRSNSEEAKLLFVFGLNRHPPIDVLLKIAAGRPPMNQRALDYLLANFQTQYSMFKAEDFPNLAFLPATTPHGDKFLAKPGEVFVNPECAILGFAIAEPIIASSDNATKLGVQRDPPMEQLVNALINSATLDIDKATKIFEYMGSQVGRAVQISLNSLQDTAIIPVPASASSSVKLHKPSQVYFVSKDAPGDLFSSAFTFIDFGSKANMFLRYCGVKSEPSIKDIVLLMINDPNGLLKQAGSAEKYLEQLRLLATNYNRLDAQTRSSMRAASFLLASQKVYEKKSSAVHGQSDKGGDDGYEMEWVLSRANDIVINDSVVLAQYFGEYVLSAPEERLLEDLYANLGAKPLSSFVKSQYIASPLPTRSTSTQAAALRQHILERLTIFLADPRRRSSGFTAENLSSGDNFKVEEVNALKVQYIYRKGKTEKIHNENLYASATVSRGKNIVMSISLSVPRDDYDIASALCEILFKTQKADEALLLYSILTTPLMALKKRGYNVDRILNQQKEEKLRFQAEVKREAEKEAGKGKEKGNFIGQQDQQEDVVTKRQSGTSQDSLLGSATDQIKGMKGLFNKLRGTNDRLGNEKEKERLLHATNVTNGEQLGRMPGLLPESKIMSALKKRQAEDTGLSGTSLADVDGVLNSEGPKSTAGYPHRHSAKHPTDLSSIRATVKQAMDASRPETATKIYDSRQAATNVSEANEGFCEPAIHVGLQLAYESSPQNGLSMQIWCPKDVNNLGQFFEDKMETCIRFIQQILVPLCEVYLLKPSVVNVFWDLEGGTIAFNRGGVIYCNARYFQAWHNQMCLNNQNIEPWISWYFTLAHELAHNLGKFYTCNDMGGADFFNRGSA